MDKLRELKNEFNHNSIEYMYDPIFLNVSNCQEHHSHSTYIFRHTCAFKKYFSFKIESGLQEIMMLYSLTTSILIAVNLTYLMFRIQ